MRTRPRAFAVAVLGLILPLAAAAQTPDATTAPTIENLAWIAGTWATDLDDQVLEERWSPPMANAMTGSFRWARDGELWLYEFLIIEETDDGIFYYMRHFSPGSVGWEERDAPLTYQLETLEPGRAVFASTSVPGDSFVFSRDGQQLTIEVASGEDVKRFVYTLQTPSTADELEVPGTADDAAEPAPTGPTEDSPEPTVEGAEAATETAAE